MAGSSGAIKAGEAYVLLGADLTPLKKGLADASSTLKGWGTGIAAAGAAIAGLGAAGTAFFGAAISKWVEGGTRLEELSKKTGASVESLSSLGYVAERNGGSVEGLGMAFRKMSQFISKAQDGSDMTTRSLDGLGVSLAELNATEDIADKFRILGAALGRIESPTRRAALAIQLFGRTGTEFLPIFAEGAEGLAKMEQKARDLGLVTSGESAKAAKEFGNALKDLWAVQNKIISTIGGALAPKLKETVEVITKNISVLLNFVKANKEWVPVIAAVFGGLVVLGTAIVAVGVGIVALGAVLGSLTAIAGAAAAAISALWLAITTPGLVIAAAVIGATAAFLYFSGTAGEALQWVSDQFSGLGDVAISTWGGIKNAMAAGDLALAARIAWLGIRLAVLENTQAMQLAWINFTASVQATGAQAFAVVAGGWVTIRAYGAEAAAFLSEEWLIFTLKLRAYFDNIVAFYKPFIDTLGTIWETLMNYMGSTFSTMIDKVFKGLKVVLGAAAALGNVAAKGALTLLIAGGKEVGQLEPVQAFRQHMQMARQEADAAIAKIDAELQEKLADIEAKRVAAAGGVGDAAAEAKIALENAIAAAAAAAKKKVVGEAAEVPKEFLLGAALQKALPGLGSSRGTFNPFAAGALGSADKVVENGNKANKHLKHIADRLDQMDDDLGP